MVHSSRVNTFTLYKVKHAAQMVQASVCMHIPPTTKLEDAMKSLITKGRLAWTLLQFYHQ